LQIKLSGVKVCGNTPQTAILMDAFTIRNFSAAELIGMLGNCPKLSTNNYTLCAQFFNIDNYPISKEYCKDFLVGDVVMNQNLFPKNEKVFDMIVGKIPLTQGWMPVVQRPKEQVKYRFYE
jgi:hypothetical protein